MSMPELKHTGHFNYLSEDKRIQQIFSALETDKQKIQLRGLIGSAKSLLANTVINNSSGNHLFLLSDKEEAAYFYNDLLNIGNVKHDIHFLPSSFKRSIQYRQEDKGNIILRSEIFNNLKSTRKKFILVSFPEAIIEKVVSKEIIQENSLLIHKEEKISIDFIQEVLYSYNFEQVDFVYEPGQFAVRGSIVDVFSYSSERPYRIDFFGDEVESIRDFDIETQLSKKEYKKIDFLPNLQGIEQSESKQHIFDFLSKELTIWSTNLNYFYERISHIYDNTKISTETNEGEEIELNKNLYIISKPTIAEHVLNSKVVEFGNKVFHKNSLLFDFQYSKQPSFNKNFDLLVSDIRERINSHYEIFILSESEKQLERLQRIFEDKEVNFKYTSLNFTFHEGFIDKHHLKCYYTDHQIFDRYHKFKIKSGFDKKESLTVKEISNLNPGDYVVHIDHGIGKFGGLVRNELNGKIQEAIRLVYKDGDILDVSIHALHRITKYKGKDGTPPKIYKLGGNAWSKLKQNTKQKVKDIARELIALYAKRKDEKGFSFSPDSYLQEELEASFIYEDTPDQNKATRYVKNDMESDKPMDRLVCGDVGFGKTEIAIRAAFKAVADNKQVAILVPTTILALQHFKTFSERLKDFPCSVDYISRLKKPKQIKETLEKAAEGKVDILIGTHRLLSKDIKFKDLGLFIIDEEQKFGVSSKEKLRQLKLNVDTLTLTATPIPRTMQFSLMGARDLSIINTPPPNRHPILTELHSFNEEIIKEAINYEFERNGQVFFINNRIQNISDIEALIKRICPEVRTIVAHGQMEGQKLEKIMLDFIDYEYDVLIATTIIESGLDIPNANTIIINNAQNFGLSDLHQLRGRVGRSNKKAFCYLLAPPLNAVTQEARRRLVAIENFSELGSGFNIALQDLDIRGAGNLLGGEQSGFITDIGYETYHRILDEAMLELRHNEFKDVFEEENIIERTEKWLSECQIDTDMEIRIPENYVRNISERIHLYRKLDSTENDEQLDKIQLELLDRFGKIPDSVDQLLLIVRLRWLAMDLGFEKLVLKNNKLIASFITNQQSDYYKSSTFSNIIAFIQNKPKRFKLKEDNNKLRLNVQNIGGIRDAIDLFQQMKEKS